MICENCGCDYARSRPACPECGTPAPGYEKWATDGKWVPPAPVEGGELPPVLASWRTSVGWSIAGLLVGFACMAAAALLGAGLYAVCLALFIVLTPAILYFGNAQPQEFLRGWSQAYPAMAVLDDQRRRNLPLAEALQVTK